MDTQLLHYPSSKLSAEELFLSKSSEKWEIFSTDPEEIDQIEKNSANLIYLRQKVNDLRRINKHLITINEKLQTFGLLVCNCETLDQRYKRIKQKYGFGAILYLPFDFLLKRVAPKINGLRRIYFAITQGRNRVLSKAEILGRLHYCGFHVVKMEEVDNFLHLILKKAKAARIDAIICWDMFVLGEAKKLGLEIHLSTQASVANSQAAEFYRKQGVKRIVLARECSLDQIKKIKKNSKIEIEAFVHGAMCVAVSGRCFMSQSLYGKSANRGQCLQPCRREYKITEINKDGEFVIGNEQDSGYIMSPKDLCSLSFIEKLIEAGVDCFKIEGRNRSPEYVKTVTEVYREAIDYYVENKLENRNKKLENNEFKQLKKDGMEKLKTVYHRGFSDGFYLGKPINEWCESYGSQATEKKLHLGKVTHFYNKIDVAEIMIEAKMKLKVGDRIMLQGEGTGILEQKINSMEIEHKKIKQAGQGDLIAIKVEKKVRTNDLVYVIRK